MPLSGLKAKNENDPKEEDDLRWKMTFDRRRPSVKEDDLSWKTTFNGRRPSMEDDRWADVGRGRVIIGEVSLQKSFLYSGCMCWEDDLKNLNGPQQ